MNKKIKKLASIFLCCTLLYQNSVIAFATEDAREVQVQDASYSEPPNLTELVDPKELPTIPKDEMRLASENELAQTDTPPVDLGRYSASIHWSEANGAQPSFSCSPAWNPETHSYDQWEFTANSPLVVQNTSEGSTVIFVEIFFKSNMQAHRQLTLYPYEVGEDSIIVTLAAGEKKNIYLSISSTDPMLEVTDEVCVGMISYRIVAAVSENEGEQFAEAVAQEQLAVAPEQPDIPLENGSTDESPHDDTVSSAKSRDEGSPHDSSESSEQSCNVQSESLPEENNNAESNYKT